MPRRVARREFIESTIATTALVAKTPRGNAVDRPSVEAAPVGGLPTDTYADTASHQFEFRFEDARRTTPRIPERCTRAHALEGTSG